MHPSITAQGDRPVGDRAAFDDGLTRAEPSAVGIDAAAIEAFIDDLATTGLEIHGLMLHRHDRVVAEGWWWPYRADRPRVMHSATKSFTACAIGMALEEGRFALTDTVVSFFPEFLPATVDDRLAAMTVEDLLTMRTGHATETSGAGWRGIATSWIAEFFKIPVVHQPGTVYVYTSAASYMLSAILTRTTGETLHGYLKPRLFEPLGIAGEHWDIGPDGLNPGGNGLTCRTADLLKLGILHAQNGIWNGRRLLSEDWIAAATRSHGDGEYGYHWAIGKDGAFSAIGVFLQMAMVFPRHGATLAVIAAINEGSRPIMPLIYKHFPTAFKDAPIAGAQAADTALKQRLAGATTPKILKNRPSALADKISGVPFRVEPNAAGVTEVRFDFSDDTVTFHVITAAATYIVVAGLGRWIEGETGMRGADLHHGYRLASARVVAGAVWRYEATLEMCWIFAETAFRDTVICHFDGDRVTVNRGVNVNSAALTQPVLTGVAERE
jgi:CubicO group peptidase (beta-lactamase class C family)